MEEFIIAEFGEEKGKVLCSLWKDRLTKLIVEYVKDQTKKQQETLKNVILQRIALYQILSESDEYKAIAEKTMEKYMCEVIGRAQHEQYAKMEKIPFFFSIFASIFSSYTVKSGLWESTLVVKNRKRVAVDIHKCLWHDACVDNGCPELCQYFCKCDEVTYRGLKKLTFMRTSTLGTGGSKCDFAYERK